MSPEQRIAYLHARTTAARIELESMLAANVARLARQLAPAYGERAFLLLIEKYELEHLSILTTLTDQGAHP